MNYFHEREATCHTSSAAITEWSNIAGEVGGELGDEICYSKTKQSVLLGAVELAELSDDQTTRAFEWLMQQCQLSGRSEIAVEGLEALLENCDYRSVQDIFVSIQCNITRASRALQMCTPRIALEKHGQGFVLRIATMMH